MKITANKITIVLLIILASVFFIVANYFYNIKVPVSPSGAAVELTINSGESVKVVGQKLAAARIIKSAFYFQVYLRLHHLESKIKAGKYYLSPKQSIEIISKLLTSGDVVDREKDIKIIEGWKLDDISKYLATNKIAAASDFATIEKMRLGQWNLNFPKPEFLNDAPANASLEGYIFPDTYRIFTDAKAEDIITKALNNFNKKLTPEMRAEIIRQKKTIFEIITMASIIEKEVRSQDDMKIIAGIFWARANTGYPLESCATLAYALGENKKQYSYEDTQIDSPYNTYRNQGLPPGPICNPGLNAIMAAIYPRTSPYHYFLSRPDTGETVFSKTYNEHLQNKAKYLK
jgi:UPF0755 protein